MQLSSNQLTDIIKLVEAKVITESVGKQILRDILDDRC